jgi:hypothetical protein
LTRRTRFCSSSVLAQATMQTAKPRLPGTGLDCQAQDPNNRAAADKALYQHLQHNQLAAHAIQARTAKLPQQHRNPYVSPDTPSARQTAVHTVE